MTTKTYAILDAHAVGPFESIQNGGAVASCDTDAQDYNRLIRATEGFSEGIHYFECTYYGEGDLAGKSAMGIVTSSHPLSKYVGFDASGVGYKPGDGDIWVNNASVATVAITAKLITIGVLLDLVAGEVTFLISNTAVATITLTPGQTWYPAVSVGSTIAFDISAYMQFGTDAFRYPQPNNPGWFTETSGFGAIYLCDQAGHLTRSSDVPANRSYDPRILNSSQFSVSRKSTVWPWGGTNAGSSFSSLSIKNDDGAYDYLLNADVRDAVVTVRLIPQYGLYADSFVVATAMIDQISSVGENAITISLQDTLVSLKRSLQTKKFPPYVDEGAANRPEPITLGAVRQVAPILVDEENRIFKVGDQPITNIGVLRQQGDPLDRNASPPDFTPTEDLAGVKTQVMPIGKLTGDFSSLGDQYVIPGIADVLAGNGQFTAWPSPSGDPTGWTSGGTSGTQTRIGIAQGVPQDYAAMLITSDPWLPGTHVGKWLRTATALLSGGRSYILTLKVFQATGTPPHFIGDLSFGLRILTALNNRADSSITPFNLPITVPRYRGNDNYSFQFTVPAGAARYLYFVVTAANGLSSGVSSGSALVSFYGIRLEELPEVAPEIPLQGITLEDAYRNIIETRAGLTSSDWESSDAAAIDAATGYTYGLHVESPIKIDEALRTFLDSSCAALFTDHLGRIRVRRLIDPATVDDADVVMDLRGVMYQVKPEIDRADGLTTAAGARLNNVIMTPTDFVSDLNPVTGIDAATRWKFQQRAQFMQTSNVGLAAYYSFARDNDPIYTLMDDPEMTQAEIDRVNGFYTATPRFFTVTVVYDKLNAEAMAHLIFGDVIRLTYAPPVPRVPDGLPRYGLQSKKLFVVDTANNPADLSIQLRLWSGPSQ